MSGGRSYRVAALLGQGAFGSVYLADTVGAGITRRVAVKLLRPEKVSTPGLLGRLRDEARMLAAIRHRAIVRVDDLVELDGSWAIIMEYVEGCDLTELLKEGAIPPVAALAVIEEVASALHAAYQQVGANGQPLRLIHRDIKPSNLRVTAQGEVKILDFGVARAEFADREEVTTEAAFGTVPYMAPERFYGEDTPGGDIYALGITLFEMLTGVKPGKTAMDADRVPPGDKLRAQWAWLEEISQPLHDLVAQMLAARPEGRPSARETARIAATIRASLPGETLDEWAERAVPPALGRQQERRSSGPAERTGTLLIERSGAVSTASRRAPQRRSAWVWLVPLGGFLGLGAAVLLVVGAFMVPMGAKPAAPVPAVVSPPTDTKSGGGSAAPSSAATAPIEAVAPAKTPEAKPKSPSSAKAAVSEPKVETPAPVESPAVVAVAPAGPGHVVLAGDATSVSLVGPPGTFGAGEVPAGSYAAEVSFPDGTKVTTHVTVVAGAHLTLRCSASFQNCKVSGG